MTCILMTSISPRSGYLPSCRANAAFRAQRIGVSHSAASHALAKLRKKLADPLFTRTQDGFQPTPFGARLAHASCEALDALLAGLAANDFFDPLTSTRTFSFFMKLGRRCSCRPCSNS